MNDIKKLLNELITLEDQKIKKSINKEALEIKGKTKLIKDGLVPEMKKVLDELITLNEKIKKEKKKNIKYFLILKEINIKKNLIIRNYKYTPKSSIIEKPPQPQSQQVPRTLLSRRPLPSSHQVPRTSILRQQPEPEPQPEPRPLLSRRPPSQQLPRTSQPPLSRRPRQEPVPLSPPPLPQPVSRPPLLGPPYSLSAHLSQVPRINRNNSLLETARRVRTSFIPFLNEIERETIHKKISENKIKIDEFIIKQNEELEIYRQNNLYHDIVYQEREIRIKNLERNNLLNKIQRLVDSIYINESNGVEQEIINLQVYYLSALYGIVISQPHIYQSPRINSSSRQRLIDNIIEEIPEIPEIHRPTEIQSTEIQPTEIQSTEIQPIKQEVIEKKCFTKIKENLQILDPYKGLNKDNLYICILQNDDYDECDICFSDRTEFIIFGCGHDVCTICFPFIKNYKCPSCRTIFNPNIQFTNIGGNKRKKII